MRVSSGGEAEALRTRSRRVASGGAPHTLLPVLQHRRHFREHVVNRIVIARANPYTDRRPLVPGPLQPAQDDPGQHGGLARPRWPPEEDQAFGEGARDGVSLSRVEGMREGA